MQGSPAPGTTQAMAIVMRELWAVVEKTVQVVREGIGCLLQTPVVGEVCRITNLIQLEVVAIERGHLCIIFYGSFFCICYYHNR